MRKWMDIQSRYDMLIGTSMEENTLKTVIHKFMLTTGFDNIPLVGLTGEKESVRVYHVMDVKTPDACCSVFSDTNVYYVAPYGIYQTQPTKHKVNVIVTIDTLDDLNDNANRTRVVHAIRRGIIKQLDSQHVAIPADVFVEVTDITT